MSPYYCYRHTYIIVESQASISAISLYIQIYIIYNADTIIHNCE